MPWSCWIELEDKDVHCEEWEYTIEYFTEEGWEANTTVFAAGSLGAITTHCISWVLSGRSALEQMRKPEWQQVLQAEQIADAGPNRVSPLTAFQITEMNEGGMMAITTTRVTQVHDIVKTLQERPESAKEILWSECPWLAKELEKALENYYEIQSYSHWQHVATISAEGKTSVC